MWSIRVPNDSEDTLARKLEEADPKWLVLAQVDWASQLKSCFQLPFMGSLLNNDFVCRRSRNARVFRAKKFEFRERSAAAGFAHEPPGKCPNGKALTDGQGPV